MNYDSPKEKIIKKAKEKQVRGKKVNQSTNSAKKVVNKRKEGVRELLENLLALVEEEDISTGTGGRIWDREIPNRS
jgi:hypothetical protein